MKINQFSQQGKRGNNEDSLGHSAGLLTVCDGIGGHVSGERASAFVVEAMLKAFDQPAAIGKMEIQQQLNKVQTDLNQLLDKEPELEKMGTTFTGVFLTPDVWYAAHIGDSRIYLFRPSEQKLWHTWDHSIVGELMRTKEITIEAGRFHPMSNRIGKAILAQKEGKPASASIVKIDELKAGDVFLLCSDGVIEAWGDLELVKLFSDTSLSFEQKCEKLRTQCDEKSKDNNTALVVEIEKEDEISFGHNEELEWTTFAEVETDYNKYVEEEKREKTIRMIKEMRQPQAVTYGPPPASVLNATGQPYARGAVAPQGASPAHPNGAAPVPPQETAPVAPDNKAPVPEQKEMPKAPNPPQPQKKRKLWGIIIGVLAALVAVMAIAAVGLFFVLRGPKTVDNGNGERMVTDSIEQVINENNVEAQ